MSNSLYQTSAGLININCSTATGSRSNIVLSSTISNKLHCTVYINIVFYIKAIINCASNNTGQKYTTSFICRSIMHNRQPVLKINPTDGICSLYQIVDSIGFALTGSDINFSLLIKLNINIASVLRYCINSRTVTSANARQHRIILKMLIYATLRLG